MLACGKVLAMCCSGGCFVVFGHAWSLPKRFFPRVSAGPRWQAKPWLLRNHWWHGASWSVRALTNITNDARGRGTAGEFST